MYRHFFELGTSDKNLVEHKQSIYDLSDYETDIFENRVLWLDFESDMKKYSKNFPKVIFTLFQNCENGEKAMYFFKNGKMQNANVRLISDKFDEDKLV